MSPRPVNNRKSRGRRKRDLGGIEAKLRRRLIIERAKREVLQEIGRVPPERRSPEKLYDHYLGVVLKLTGTGSGSIWLLDEITGKLGRVARKGRRINRNRRTGVPDFEGLAAGVIKTGQAFSLNGGFKPIRKSGPAVTPGDPGMVAVPLRISGRVQGVLEVHHKKNRRPFLPDDLGLLTAIARQLATVIENSRVVQKYSLKVKKLTAMREMSRLLNSTLEQDEVRRRAVEAATALMEAEAGSLLLIDSASQELYFEVAFGPRGEKIKEIRLKIGEGIAGWVAKTGRAVNIPDVQGDSRFNPAADKKSEFTTRNMLCVPVQVKGKIIGVLQAINKIGGAAFSGWDMEDFQGLADQVAVAIENSNLYRELQEAFLGTIQALGDAIEAKDAYTAGHTQRVLTYSETVGRRMGLSGSELEDLRLAAVLHDIGKIGVEDRILLKTGKLDETELKRMREHTRIGPRIVERIERLKRVGSGIRHHHEEVDGSGYPRGLKGEEIPLMSRIIAVADCFDAMTTDRPYRKGLPVRRAVEELQSHAGTQFDRSVVRNFLEAFKEGHFKMVIKNRSKT